MDINILKIIIQYLAIGCFAILSIIGYKQHDFNTMGMNFSLVLTYIFIYLCPFIKK
jgi:branched-subunit amino acid transport protein AzlD